MTAQTYLLLAVAVLLAVSLVMLLCQPRNTSRPPNREAGTLSIDIECDPEPAMAGLGKIKDALERIVALQAQAGLNGRVDVREAKDGRKPTSVNRPTSPSQQPKRQQPAKPRRR